MLFLGVNDFGGFAVFHFDVNVTGDKFVTIHFMALESVILCGSIKSVVGFNIFDAYDVGGNEDVGRVGIKCILTCFILECVCNQTFFLRIQIEIAGRVKRHLCNLLTIY